MNTISTPLGEAVYTGKHHQIEPPPHLSASINMIQDAVDVVRNRVDLFDEVEVRGALMGVFLIEAMRLYADMLSERPADVQEVLSSVGINSLPVGIYYVANEWEQGDNDWSRAKTNTLMQFMGHFGKTLLAMSQNHLNNMLVQLVDNTLKNTAWEDHTKVVSQNLFTLLQNIPPTISAQSYEDLFDQDSGEEEDV
jgi:hypothetical protein